MPYFSYFCIIRKRMLMNSREKQIVTCLFDTENELRRNESINILFNGKFVSDKDGHRHFQKTPYAKAIENAVRKYFSGLSRYDVKFEHLYCSFETEFLEFLIKKGRDKLLEIDQLDRWLFTAACHFAANPYYRKKVVAAVGVDESTDYAFIGLDVTTDRDEESMSADSTDAIVVDCPETGIDQKMKIPEPDDSYWAENKIRSYIDKIPHEYYRTILRAIMLDNVSHDDFAKQQGKRKSAIYNDLSRAMDSLIVAALPDIRFRTRQMFKLYGDRLSDESARCLMEQFYSGRHTIADIAARNGLTESKLNSILAKAYGELRKFASKDAACYNN